jgi:hypothetical protein
MSSSLIRIFTMSFASSVFVAGCLNDPESGPTTTPEQDQEPATGMENLVDNGGSAGAVHTLSAKEIRARGLEQYVALGDPLAFATQCWSHTFTRGQTSGPFTLYGYTDVTWCGNGSAITYANSNAGGIDGGYPTYEYIGYDKHTDFGVGWAIYKVTTTHNLCPAWVPLWGSCLSNWYPWSAFTYTDDGEALIAGSGG